MPRRLHLVRRGLAGEPRLGLRRLPFLRLPEPARAGALGRRGARDRHRRVQHRRLLGTLLHGSTLVPARKLLDAPAAAAPTSGTTVSPRLWTGWSSTGYGAWTGWTAAAPAISSQSAAADRGTIARPTASGSGKWRTSAAARNQTRTTAGRWPGRRWTAWTRRRFAAGAGRGISPTRGRRSTTGRRRSRSETGPGLKSGTLCVQMLAATDATAL